MPRGGVWLHATPIPAKAKSNPAENILVRIRPPYPTWVGANYSARSYTEVMDSPPQRADWTIDQGWQQYTPAQHAVWNTLFERQLKLLAGRTCDEFVAGMQALPIGADQIPDFRRLSDALMKATGWQVVAVPGLVPDEVFFEHLANRRFPSGNFIRKADELDYLEEPDVFHDVFGHVPMLMHPVIADYIQAYGQGGLKAQRLGEAGPASAGLLVHGGVRAGAAG